jgi:hypothetical protein
MSYCFHHGPTRPADFPESHLRAVENKITYLQEFAHTMKVYRNALVSCRVYLL